MESSLTLSIKKRSRILIITAVILVILASSCLLSACYKKKVVAVKNVAIGEDVKFNAAIVGIAIEDFNDRGFALGDSCDVRFSNGYEMTDVPYYNGYYVQNGQPVIVAYPSDKFIKITLNNVGIWDVAELNDSCTVDITLNTAKKYLATQEALGQSYSLDRNSYDSDESFANFRAISGGNLKENLIFRGASPVDNSRNRARYVDALLEIHEIKCVIDLADSFENIAEYTALDDFFSEYTLSLLEKGDVALLSMSSSYGSDAYKRSLVKGFEFMLSHDGPYYIHCMEGKDRTGFVCALIEALAGASYEEMRNDYMMTYENYYKIFPDSNPEKYDAVVKLYFDSFMRCISGKDDLSAVTQDDYVSGAKSYLMSGGMSEENVNLFIGLISK